MEEKKSLKRYFHKSQFSLEHPEPLRFVQGPWHPGVGPPVRPMFLMFRILITSLFVGILLWSIIVHWRAGKWLIFATHWGFTMCSIQAVLGCYVVVSGYIQHRCSQKNNKGGTITTSSRPMTLLYKVYWATYNMAMPVAFAVSALYWGIIYPSGQKVQDGPANLPLNIMMHAGNSVLCLIEIFIGGLPSRPAHAHHAFLFGVSYVIFNVSYWALGGLGPFDAPYVYKTLDWGGRPSLAVALGISGLVLLVVFHIIICGLAKLRSKWVRWKHQKNENISNLQLPEINGGKLNTGYVP